MNYRHQRSVDGDEQRIGGQRGTHDSVRALKFEREGTRLKERVSIRVVEVTVDFVEGYFSFVNPTSYFITEAIVDTQRRARWSGMVGKPKLKYII
jgi:hypothetical protein